MREASLFLHKPNISGNGSAEPAYTVSAPLTKVVNCIYQCYTNSVITFGIERQTKCFDKNKKVANIKIV